MHENNWRKKNIVTLKNSIPQLLNAMICNEKSNITNPLKSKIAPNDKLLNYELASQADYHKFKNIMEIN